MKEKARQILEYVINTLDKDIRSSQSGTWKLQTEKEIESCDDETLHHTYVSLNVIMNAQEARENAIGKILVGENIFTPSLTNRGWQFWKKPL